MLETVTQPGGTGTKAAIPGYRVKKLDLTKQLQVGMVMRVFYTRWWRLL